MFEDNTIIGQISKGKYPEEIVETAYGDFVLKFPSGKDLNLIARKKAVALNGLPIRSFDAGFLNYNERDCTLSVMITSYPEKFPKEFTGDNIEDFPSEEVKNALFKAFNIFYSKQAERISEQCIKKN